MSSPEDRWQPAATIAAALIARMPPNAVVTAADAVDLYREVLALMQAPTQKTGS